jgi:hypothetical protein
MTVQKEFGDFQTPLNLAENIVSLVEEICGKPSRVIEPTAGLGSFLEAAYRKWGKQVDYQGYEINESYVSQARERLSSQNIRLTRQDFFQADWKKILSPSSAPQERLLVLGNPPWVTNATLGALGSSNLPTKTNFQGLRGFDARTGKANFDIAEWMLIRLMESLPSHGAMAMLCKTMTARKVLRYFWKKDGGFARSSLFLIDAKKHFDVSVDACLFFVSGKRISEKVADIYSELTLQRNCSRFGWVDGQLVSNLSDYKRFRDVEGGSSYVWRSGVKHDASDVMELQKQNGHYVNGLGEEVNVEADCIYPLLKSSDIANGRITARRFVLITQKSTADQTDVLKKDSPQIWKYLESHAIRLGERKSSIYLKRPQYCIFGIGAYSFSKWKVAISGLYKTLKFVVVPPLQNRPVMLDDTCYFIPCEKEVEAKLISELLNSEPCQKFLHSLIFLDSKRPITTEILRRVSLAALAKRAGRMEEWSAYMKEPQLELCQTGRPWGLVRETQKKFGVVR